MSVTWISPSGHVGMFFITIQQDQTLIQNVTKTTNEVVVFQNLLPGKSYTVKVTTKSGQFEEQSDMVTNATCKLHKVQHAGLLSYSQMKQRAFCIGLSFIHIWETTQMCTVQILMHFRHRSYYLQYVLQKQTICRDFFFDLSSVPNPPRELKVEQYSNSSISLTWKRPLNMSEGSHRYIVTYGETTVTTTNDNISLSNLSSGIEYTIIVKTVGAMNYESSEVNESQYTSKSLLQIQHVLWLSLFCSLL